MYNSYFIPSVDSDYTIETFDFSDANASVIAREKKNGENWPVIYVIHENNEKNVYIGETTNFSQRIKEHQQNPEKKIKGFKKISFLSNGFENKSVILDYEASLIRLCCADEKIKVINKNYGQSQSHNYFARPLYKANLKKIWDVLQKTHIVSKNYEDVVNANLFKYSPYTSLTPEQNNVVYDVMNNFLDKKNGVSIINGGAGTGKTLLAMKMLYILNNYSEMLRDFEDFRNSSIEDLKNKYDEKIVSICKKLKSEKTLKIGFIVPQQSLREDLEKVFKKVDGINEKIIFSPGSDEFGKWKEDEFDILFVDEAHRLRHASYNGKNNCIKNSPCKNFQDACSHLFPNDSWTEKNQLDVLLKCAKHVVLFYDENQSISTNDITPQEWKNSISLSRKSVFERLITTQLRCGGGNSFVSYVHDIFDGKNPFLIKSSHENYRFEIFDSIDEMHDEILMLNKKFGLCRLAAGYAWPWKLKQKANEIKRDQNLQQAPKIKSVHKMYPKLCDIPLGKGYIWNTQDRGWISSKNSENEVGCIHTTQGYDLNFVGLIIGPDLVFRDGKITVDMSKFCDTFTEDKDSIDESFILNAYKTMLFRGVLGCFVYVCDEPLRNYLKQFIPLHQENLYKIETVNSNNKVADSLKYNDYIENTKVEHN